MKSILSGSRRAAFVVRLGLLTLLMASISCGPGKGTVSGQVLFDGKPLPGGRVTFRPTDGQHNSVSAELNEQGTFEVTLPAGEVKVCVDNTELEPAPSMGPSPLPPGLPPDLQQKLKGSGGGKAATKGQDGATGRPSGRYVKIPERYYQVETSGLQFKVVGGAQKHNLELTR